MIVSKMKYPKDYINKVIQGDCLEVMKNIHDNSVDCCITSPPYWGLRDYGTEGQLGLEKTPEEYVANMVKVFGEVKRVLRDDGTLWLNLGDSYANKGCDSSSVGGFTGERVRKKLAGLNPNDSVQDSRPREIPPGLKVKDLVGIPWRVAFALQADGWYLRQDIIWHKPNPMPESVTDRCTKSHEYIFLLAKSQKYYFDANAIKEPLSTPAHSPGQSKIDKSRNDQDMNDRVFGADGKRNKRSVWRITTKPFKEAHFATFPEDLIVPMVKAGCPEKGIVLDPFFGAGTTAMVSQKLRRNYLGIELNAEYIKIAENRLRQKSML